MRQLHFDVLAGDVAPKGYGLAYYKLNQDVGVFYPIPLNVFVRFYRDLWYWFVRGCYKSRWDREQARLINRGRTLERGARSNKLKRRNGMNPLCPHCGQPMLPYRNSDSDRMLHRTFFCACRQPLTWHNELTKRTGTITEVIESERTQQ